MSVEEDVMKIQKKLSKMAKNDGTVIFFLFLLWGFFFHFVLIQTFNLDAELAPHSKNCVI
jgi:hypothetical protein